MLLKYLNDKSNFYLSSQMLSLFDLVLVLDLDCSAGLTERHVLVGAEESHELWHLDDLNESSLVDIEVSPGLGEVGVDVVVEHLAGETLVGGEDLLGGSEGRGLVHPELSTWLTTGLKSVGVLTTLVLSSRAYCSIIDLMKISSVSAENLAGVTLS